MPQSVDEITAGCAAAKAKGHAEDAERSLGRVREAVATFEAARAGHATPYAARGAAITVRLRTTKAARCAAQNVRCAEYQAEKARKAAKTPKAREYAIKAAASILVASEYAHLAMGLSYKVSMKSYQDCIRACEAYIAEPTESD